MNQILVNEHDSKKKKETNQIGNVEPFDMQQGFENIEEPLNMQQGFEGVEQPFDVQPSFENMEQPFDIPQNFDNIGQPYDTQLDFNSTQQSYDIQPNFDNIEQPYGNQTDFNNIQSYDEQVNYEINQTPYNEQQNFENPVSYNNQPSYTNSNYESKTIQKVEIQKIIRIFCIIIIIFGLVLGGKALFTFVKSKNNKKDTPVVNIDKMGREATISIVTQKPIKEYSYQWNKDGEPEVEEGNGRVSVEKTIQIPNGNNILNIVVTDYYGNRTKYFKQYIYESTDTTKPTINLSAVGNKLKITAEDETEILYMTYSWNDEEEIRIDVSQDDNKKIEEEIEVPEGQNKLTITAVDKEENKERRTENIVGDNKPTFDIQTDGENIIVIAKDDEGVGKISITIDDVTTDSGDTPINQTEVTAKLPISRGTHTITVTVTNINGLSETNTVTHTF